MSFIGSSNGLGFTAGRFLAGDENCTCQTATVAAGHAAAKSVDGMKYVPAGSVIPANDATAIGILYEDIDVTKGDMPGSVVTSGKVYEDQLPAAVAEAAKAALKGIEFVAAKPTVTRPY